MIPKLALAFGLVFLGFLSRLLPHAPNVTPLVAIALFAGSVLPWQLSLVIPVLSLVGSDWVIGFDTQVVWTWLAFTLVVALGWSLKDRPLGWWKVTWRALLSSGGFFLFSNYGVWCDNRLYDGLRMYPDTWAGLRQCYVNGLPFLRAQVVGDLSFTYLLFGLWVVGLRYIVREAPQCS